MVGLDDSCITGAAFDHVRINGALCQKVYRAQLLGFPFKSTDKFLADRLTLGFRIGNAVELFHESSLGIDADKVDVLVCKCSFYFVAFVLPQEAVVYKNTGQLLADCTGQQCRTDRTVYAAGQCQQYPTVADFFPNLGNSSFRIVAHGPVAGAAADIFQKAVQHRQTLLSVVHFRMKLYCIQLPFRILHSSYRTVLCMCRNGKALRCFRDVVGVAHPRNCLFRQFLAAEQSTGLVISGFCLAVFRGGAGRHLTAESIRHQLTAVADAQDRDTHFKNFFGDMRRFFIVNAVRTAGEDNTHRFPCCNFLQRCGIANHFAVNAAFPHASGNKLIVLTAEVQYQNQLIFHRLRFLSVSHSPMRRKSFSLGNTA